MRHRDLFLMAGFFLSAVFGGLIVKGLPVPDAFAKSCKSTKLEQAQALHKGGKGAKAWLEPTTDFIDKNPVIAPTPAPNQILKWIGGAWIPAADDTGGGPGTNYWILIGDSLYPADIGWNVGIGTSTPAYKLDVNGDVKISGGIQDGTDFGSSGEVLKTDGADIYWGTDETGTGADDDWDGAGTGKMYPHTLTDSVGIGTASPSELLDVQGSDPRIRIKSSDVTSATLELDGGDWQPSQIYFYNDGSLKWRLRKCGTEDFSLFNQGKIEDAYFVEGATNHIGIGTVSPASWYQLTVDGGADYRGIRVESSKGDGFGVDAYVTGTNSKGLRGRSTGTSGIGTEGYADDAGGVGVYGCNASSGSAAGFKSFVQLSNKSVSPFDPTIVPDASFIYAKDAAASSEVFVMDEGGNVTQISPHDPITGEWIFYSKNVNTGRVVRVNMERLVKKIEDLTGEEFMIETWE